MTTRTRYAELLQALETTLAHAEEMLMDEFKTDDLSDWPWVQEARAAIANARRRRTP